MKPINYISKYQIVEEIINNLPIPAIYKQDLIQEIYLILLEYNEDKLKYLIDNNMIKFFISRIITNNYYSKTSPFYKKYVKPLRNNTKSIQDIINEEEKE